MRQSNARNTKNTEKKPAKYKDKTMADLSSECLYHILKSLSKEDKLQYFVLQRGGSSGSDAAEVHQCSHVGDEKMFTCEGRASIGCFSHSGTHYLGPDGESGVEITYKCKAKVEIDSIGQPIVSVGEYTVDGLDDPLIRASA